MQKFTLVLVVVLGLVGRGSALNFPMVEKWRVKIGGPNVVLSDRWIEEGEPHFLTHDANRVYIYSSTDRLWKSDSIPGMINCCNRIEFPQPYGTKIIIGYDCVSEDNETDIVVSNGSRDDSLSYLNLSNFFPHRSGNGVSTKSYFLKFLRSDTLTDPTTFYAVTSQDYSFIDPPYFSGYSEAALYAIKLKGYVNDRDPFGIKFRPSALSISCQQGDGSRILLVGGSEYAYDYYSGGYSGGAVSLTKYNSDLKTYHSYCLSSGGGVMPGICTLSGLALAQTGSENFAYAAFFTKDGTQKITKVNLNDMLPADSLKFPIFRERWDLIPIKDPVNAEMYSHLLAISNQGEVIPFNLADFAYGDVYNIGCAIEKAFGWDSDQDGKEEIFLQTGSYLFCYQMPKVGVSSQKIALPVELEILGTYPNPFNSSLTVNFNVPTTGDVRVALFDINGREVVTLFDGHKQAGSHTISWEAVTAPAGVYLVRLTDGVGRISVRKVAVVK